MLQIVASLEKQTGNKNLMILKTTTTSHGVRLEVEHPDRSNHPDPLIIELNPTKTEIFVHISNLGDIEIGKVMTGLNVVHIQLKPK